MIGLKLLRVELGKRPNLQISDLTLYGIIGRGAFGVVRFARFKETVFRTGPMRGERVSFALKIMNKVKAAQAMGGVHIASAAFKQEITLLKELEFPFIVNLITFFHDSKRVFIAMEYVNGGELFALIYNRQKSAELTEDVALQLFTEICLTLQELHSKNIIYRDLKPENVLLDSEGHAKLVDFGLAKQLTDGRAHTNCGTLAYQAPEMLLSEQYSFEVDFWSLGVVLFELVVREVPWKIRKTAKDEAIMFAISQAIMSLNIRWPWRMNQHAKRLIKQILHPNIKKRFGTVHYPPVPHIQQSPFCQKMNWLDVLNLKVTPTYVPEVSDKAEQTLAGQNESLEDDGPEMGTADKNIWATTLEKSGEDKEPRASSAIEAGSTPDE